MTQDWQRIPEELRKRRQWCIAGSDKRPMTLWNGQLHNASVTEPSSWMSFFDAATAAWERKLGIGYVLSADDPYSCIDYDVKPDTTPERYDQYTQSVRSFDSYSEFSQSGKGFHVWVIGKIGKGVRNNGIEIYSQERFIICTGNAFSDKPIEERQMHLQALRDWLRPPQQFDELILTDGEEEDDDWYIFEKAINAANSEKFIQLFLSSSKEDALALGYPSESERDLAYMSMFAFYSKNNEQCRRLFRARKSYADGLDSGPGLREKAWKNDKALNYALKVCRQREAQTEQVNLAEIKKSVDNLASVQAAMAAQAVAELQGISASRFETNVTVPAMPPQPPIPHAAAALASATPLTPQLIEAGAEGVPWPPGFVGHIARFIYQSAPKPVKEVAIVGAIGLIAGLCGKAWHTTMSGLNLYVILIGPSGVGKEAMHSGISIIENAMRIKNPHFSNFICHDAMASGPGLKQKCVSQTCFVHLNSEWGQTLRRMARDAMGSGPLESLKQEMTALFGKSGPEAIVGGKVHSKQENNLASINSVAYSMIGETTPETFNAALTSDMMADGFLSRFLCIEYDGLRPSTNKVFAAHPDEPMLEALANIVYAATNVNNGMSKSMLVRIYPDASEVLDAFDRENDQIINRLAKTDSGNRQMHNRAYIKALRLASLLAVADRYLSPVVTLEQAEWAINLVRRDMKIFSAKLEGGDIGMTDDTREKKMINVIKAYQTRTLPPSLAADKKYQTKNHIQRSYLQKMVSHVPSFENYRFGSVAALEATIKSLIDNGYLSELRKEEANKLFSSSAKCYRILATE